MMVKRRDVFHHTFKTDAYNCNDLFLIDNRLSLKEGEKHLQQSTLVLNSIENKVLVQKVGKFKERTQQDVKEDMGLKNVHFWFPKGTLQW